MGVGTAEDVERMDREAFASGRGGGDRGGRGGGSEDRGGTNPFGTMDRSNDRVKIVTWFILLAVLMTFVGLIAAYVVVSTNGVIEWNPFILPSQIWISTFLLLLSSASYSFSHWARKAGKELVARGGLVATTVLGAAFIASQILTWMALRKAGYFMQSNPYAGLFYFITFIHALHVAGGICALGFAVLRTWSPANSASELERRLVVSTAVGQYWHFMDVLWIVLVLMFGFWK